MRTAQPPSAAVRPHRRGPHATRASATPAPAAATPNGSSPLVLALVRAASRKESEPWRPPPLPPLALSVPSSQAAALARLSGNLPRYAPVYGVAALLVACLAGVVVQPAVSAALLTATLSVFCFPSNGAFFDAVWPLLHRNDVITVGGEIFRYDNIVAIKKNGRNVGRETQLFGLPKTVMGGAAAAAAAALTVANLASTAAVLLAAALVSAPLAAAHAALVPE